MVLLLYITKNLRLVAILFGVKMSWLPRLWHSFWHWISRLWHKEGKGNLCLPVQSICIPLISFLSLLLCNSPWQSGTSVSSSQQALSVSETTRIPNTGRTGLIPGCEVPHTPGTGQQVITGSTPSVFLRIPKNTPPLCSGSRGDFTFF